MAYIEWLRSRVGKRKILLVFSSVVLSDENGRILLQRRGQQALGLPAAFGTGRDDHRMRPPQLCEETVCRPTAAWWHYTDPRYDWSINGDAVQQFTVCFAGPRAAICKSTACHPKRRQTLTGLRPRRTALR
jgi:hypothetical protein